MRTPTRFVPSSLKLDSLIAVNRRIAYVPPAQSMVIAYAALDFVLIDRTAHRWLFANPTHADRSIAQRSQADIGTSNSHWTERLRRRVPVAGVA